MPLSFRSTFCMRGNNIRSTRIQLSSFFISSSYAQETDLFFLPRNFELQGNPSRLLCRPPLHNYLMFFIYIPVLYFRFSQSWNTFYLFFFFTLFRLGLAFRLSPHVFHKPLEIFLICRWMWIALLWFNFSYLIYRCSDNLSNFIPFLQEQCSILKIR